MKRVFILLFIAIFSFQLKAQQAQVNIDYVNRAQKKIHTGSVLTLTGAGAMIGGTILFVNGMGQKYPDTVGHITNDTYTSTSGTIGFGIIIIGVSLIGIGVTTVILGGLQKERAQKNLQMTLVSYKIPINSVSINGVGVTIRF